MMDFEKIKRYIEKTNILESITHEKLYNRWVEKLHALSVEDRTKFIDSVVKKYSSDEYQKREIRMGYEPRCPLFTLFQKYAEMYGKDIIDEYSDTSFLASAMVIDNTWVIELYIGQGSFISVKKSE